MAKLNDQSRKDDVITFEELGVDKLYVLDITEMASVYASHVIHELEKLPSNIYIERYIKFLKDYIV